VRVKRFGLGYSLKGLAVRLQTTSVTVASLAVAVSMLIGITLMIDSFRRTLEVWIGTSIQADIYVSPTSWRGKSSEGNLAPEVIATLSRHAGVRTVDRLRAFRAYTGDRRIGIAGVDMQIKGGTARFPLLNGDPQVAYRQVLEAGGVFIGETLARQVGLWTGDDLPIYTPNGVKTFPIAAVYYDYSTRGGTVMMDLKTMTEAFGPGPINSVALYLKPGHDPERVVDELKAMLSNLPLEIRSNRRLREKVLQIFDQTFAVTRLLQVMSLLIAVCGIALMLLVLAREQVSELALYRSIGARRFQIFVIFVGKGLGMGLLGLVLGLGGGILLAGLLIYVINRAYFGWTIQPYAAWGAVLQQSVTILGAAVLASLYPALRASRTPATELSRDDL
jgi:putative ABC transport system permease protein